MQAFTAFHSTALCSAVQKVHGWRELPDTLLESIDRICFLFLTIWQLNFNVSKNLNFVKRFKVYDRCYTAERNEIFMDYLNN